MNKLLALALSVPLVACVVGPDGEPGGNGDGDGDGDGTGNGDGTGGGAVDPYTHITAPTTWTGTVDVKKNTMVDAGVTLTIAAGTIVKLAPATSISVKGIVDVQGTKAAPVQLAPATAGQHHYGFSIPTGGELKMAYGVQVGGGISVSGGKATVTDTRMSQAEGDFLVVDAGTLTVDYSAIGLEAGAVDSTHCDMHFGGAGTTIKVTHSNISTSSYGLMLYGGNGVDLTSNNWFGNQIDVDTTPGVSGNLSNGWFDKAAPTAGAGAILTLDGVLVGDGKQLADAGPR